MSRLPHHDPIARFKGGPAYRALLRAAEVNGLYVAPPGDERTERAFLSGYETALSDIANGSLRVAGHVTTGGPDQ